MSWETEFTVKGTPRKIRPRGQGHDPLASCRAPEPILDAIRAKAAARGVNVSAIMREALCRYVESDAA